MTIKTSLAAYAAALSLVVFFGTTAGATEKKTTDKTEKPAPVIVTVNPGDTLTAIAEAHGTDYVRLFNANEQLTHPDAIDVGNQIRIPAADEQLPDRYAAVAATVRSAAPAQATGVSRQYTSKPVNSSSYYVGNGMWCTDYVHSKRPDVAVYGNAGYNWISSAQAAGKSTGSAPRAGAVAVTNGHVAYVESVNPDGSYVVSEMGWNYKAGSYNQRTVAPGSFGGFIY